MTEYISIDIGSENIKILLISQLEKDGSFKILAKSSFPSRGVSTGYVTNQKELTAALKNAVSKFEVENNFKIEEAFFSLNGYGVKGNKISTAYQVATGVIADYDLKKIKEKAENSLKRINSDQIIGEFDIKYTLNNFEHFHNPVGLEAKKFEADFLFITKPKNNLKNLEESITNLGIFPITFLPALISSSQTTLSELDKKLGCALVDIGAETTSIVIYENNRPLHYNVLKIGSKNITQKISLEEKIDFLKAEKIKKGQVLNKKINKIIESGIKEIAQKVSAEIKKCEREKVLPGGITLVGGGSRITGIEEIFKKELSLPIKKSSRNISDNQTDYHIAYGIIVNGIKEESFSSKLPLPDFKKIFKPIQKFIKKLIP